MSAIEITISGVMYDKLSRTMQNVVLIGEASLTGVGVGGGPIVPPQSPGVPIHPIVLPGDPSWGDPHPVHPIVLPPNITPPEPPVPGADKPPPAGGGWGWVAEWGAWGYFPMGSGPAPKNP